MRRDELAPREPVLSMCDDRGDEVVRKRAMHLSDFQDLRKGTRTHGRRRERANGIYPSPDARPVNDTDCVFPEITDSLPVGRLPRAT